MRKRSPSLFQVDAFGIPAELFRSLPSDNVKRPRKACKARPLALKRLSLFAVASLCSSPPVSPEEVEEGSLP